jgi:hypothetical protein
VGVHAALIATFVGWSIDRKLSAPSVSDAPTPVVEMVVMPIDIALVTLSEAGPSGGEVVVGSPVARGTNIVATTTTAGGVATGGEAARQASPNAPKAPARCACDAAPTCDCPAT